MKKRPWSVTIISWIFVLVGVFGVILHATEIKAQRPFQYDPVWAIGVSLVAIVCGFCMLRRNDWARWLSVAWLVFHVVLSGFHSRQELIVHGALLVVFAYLLFRPEANRYFRGAEMERT
jgi:uncharacterized membrane protein YgdD (TMEM256/DUF423 family)